MHKRYKNVNGTRIKLTEKEENSRNIEESNARLRKPVENWKRDMAKSDNELMPRWMEEHLKCDHNGITMSEELQRAYNLKKTLRKTGKSP